MKVRACDWIWLASAQLKQLAEIFGHCQVAGILFFDFGLAKWRQVEQTSASARAGEEDVPGLLGDAEHVTDHGNRGNPRRQQSEPAGCAGVRQ